MQIFQVCTGLSGTKTTVKQKWQALYICFYKVTDIGTVEYHEIIGNAAEQATS